MTQARLGGSRLTMAGAYIEDKCLECGKVFLRTPEHVYRNCCTHKCMRAQEAKNERRKKGYHRDVNVLLKRVERCKERIAYHTQVIESAKPGTKAKSNAARQRREWRDKLDDYEMQLEEAGYAQPDA